MMNRAATKTNNSSSSKFGPMLTGIIFGVLLGLIMSGGVAWYALTKNPRSFATEEPQARVKPIVELKPTPTAIDKPAVADKVKPADAEVKPQYEFYKVLTETKPDSATTTEPAESIAPPAAAKEPGLLQAGAFQKQADAEKLKAKLALLGVEATIQSANVPEKGLWYRVRLGPYANANEMNKVSATLKQNGLSATPVHAQ
jgi:cell division protein FtsN